MSKRKVINLYSDDSDSETELKAKAKTKAKPKAKGKKRKVESSVDSEEEKETKAKAKKKKSKAESSAESSDTEPDAEGKTERRAVRPAKAKRAKPRAGKTTKQMLKWKLRTNYDTVLKKQLDALEAKHRVLEEADDQTWFERQKSADLQDYTGEQICGSGPWGPNKEELREAVLKIYSIPDLRALLSPDIDKRHQEAMNKVRERHDRQAFWFEWTSGWINAKRAAPTDPEQLLQCEVGPLRVASDITLCATIPSFKATSDSEVNVWVLAFFEWVSLQTYTVKWCKRKHEWIAHHFNVWGIDFTLEMLDALRVARKALLADFPCSANGATPDVMDLPTLAETDKKVARFLHQKHPLLTPFSTMGAWVFEEMFLQSFRIKQQLPLILMPVAHVVLLFL